MISSAQHRYTRSLYEEYVVVFYEEYVVVFSSSFHFSLIHDHVICMLVSINGRVGMVEAFVFLGSSLVVVVATLVF
jgi:hypothetical protein